MVSSGSVFLIYLFIYFIKHLFRRTWCFKNFFFLAIENAAADSTVPESNESSQDVAFEGDAVIKTELEVCF